MERFRRLIRNLIGYDSGLYKIGSRSVNFASICSREGLGTWRRLAQLERADPNANAPVEIALRSLEHPILIRPGTDDIGTIVNNVIREEYGQFLDGMRPRWMIDAGAYIGDTAAYFLTRYRDLKVIAIEPDPENVALAERNLLHYRDRSILYDGGLWGRDEAINIGGNYTNASVADAGTPVKGVTVTSLLDAHGITYLDILKMDIEGAEEAVFTSDPERWLARVGCLIMEFHTPNVAAEVTRLLSERGFSVRQFRSLSYFTR